VTTVQLVPPIDHIPDGLRHLISQYRGKPKVAIWIATFLSQTQHAEDALHATVEAWSIDTAVGWRLDILGAKVGQVRTGSSDDVYRLWIQARIRANRSSGRMKDLLGIADLLMPGYRYEGLNQNIHFWAPVGTLTAETALAIQQILQFATSDGSRIWLHWGAASTWASDYLRRSSAGSCLATSGSTTYSFQDGGHAPATPTTVTPGLYQALHSPAERPPVNS
jgi:hypothetical protein